MYILPYFKGFVKAGLHNSDIFCRNVPESLHFILLGQ